MSKSEMELFHDDIRYLAERAFEFGLKDVGTRLLDAAEKVRQVATLMEEDAA